jgi:hypothetical protein
MKLAMCQAWPSCTAQRVLSHVLLVLLLVAQHLDGASSYAAATPAPSPNPGSAQLREWAVNLNLMHVRHTQPGGTLH